MCGLVGVFSKRNKPVGQIVYNLFKKQEVRGKDGFGYLAIDSEWNLIGVHRAKYEFEMRKLLFAEKSPIILFHHRQPTSTKNTIGTTHPFFVSHPELKYDYYWAHNGGVTNKTELKKKHNDLGYVYQSEFLEQTKVIYLDGREETLSYGNSYFNDSECLAIELSRYNEGIVNKVGTYGPAAFWGIALEKGTNKIVSFFYGKNQGRDLCSLENKKFWGITSTQGSEVTPMLLYSLDSGDPQLYQQELDMDEFIIKREPAGFKETRQHCLPVYTEPPDVSDKRLEGMDEYLRLENKYYTYQEALDTGVPLSEFFLAEQKRSKGGSMVNLYVPSKFAGESESRKVFLDDKEQELLEDLSYKYAKIEADREMLDEFYAEGKLPYSEYEEQDKKLELQLQSYEEQISAIGAPDELVEEVLEMSRELESYNRNYSPDQLECIQIS